MYQIGGTFKHTSAIMPTIQKGEVTMGKKISENQVQDVNGNENPADLYEESVTDTPATPAADAPAEGEGSAPADDAKAAQAKAAKEMRETLIKSKQVLSAFQSDEQFSTLPADVQDAIKRLSKKAMSMSAKATTAGFLADLFPTVGTTIDEFELFKKTKKGRSEIRKNVHYALKKCEDPASRLWIRFDKKAGAWTLDQIGGECPANWTKADKPITRG